MASEVASAYVTIRAATDKLAGDLARAKEMATGFVQSVAGILSGGLGTLLGGFAVGGLVKMFADAEAGGMRFEAMFKNMGGAIGYTREQMAYMRQEVVGLSTYSVGEVNKAMTNLMRFNEIRGNDFRTVLKAAANAAAATGSDLAHTTELIGRALQTPSIAYGTLHRGSIGGGFTPQEVAALRGTKDMVQQREIIMGMLGRIGTGQAEAMRNTLSGQFKIMANEAKLVGVELGAALVPAVKAAIPGLHAMLDAIRENKEVFVSIGTAAGELVTRIADGFVAVVKWIGNLSPETKKWVGELVVAAGAIGAAVVAGGKLLTVLGLVRGVVGTLFSPINLLIAGLAVAAGVDLKKVFTDPLGAVRELFNNITGFLQANWDRFQEWGQVVVSIVTNAFNIITGAIGNTFGWIKWGLEILVEKFGISWQDIGDTITDVLYGVNDVLQNLFENWMLAANMVAITLAKNKPEKAGGGLELKPQRMSDEMLRKQAEQVAGKVELGFGGMSVEQTFKKLREEADRIYAGNNKAVKSPRELIIEDTLRQLKERDARIKAEKEKNAAARKSRGKVKEDKKDEKPDMTPSPTGDTSGGITGKIGFSHFDAMWNNIQKSLTGGSSMVDLQRHGNTVLEKIASNTAALVKKEPPPVVV